MSEGAKAIREAVVAVEANPPAVRPELPVMLKRYLEGESIQVLAAECRVTRRTIYNWLIGGLGDEAYRDTVTQALVARVADADEELEAAKDSKDPVRVSAARETCRFARMDLERRRPGLYGPKQEVNHTGRGPGLTIVLLDRPTGGAAAGDGGAVVDVTPIPEREEKGGAG